MKRTIRFGRKDYRIDAAVYSLASPIKSEIDPLHPKEGTQNRSYFECGSYFKCLWLIRVMKLKFCRISQLCFQILMRLLPYKVA